MSAMLLAGCQTTTQSNDPSASVTQATSEHLATGAKAAALCQKHMPDVAATRAAFRNAGYLFVEGQHRIQLYQVDDWNVVAQVQEDGRDDRICVVRVAMMTQTQAVDLAQPWVRAINGELLENSRSDVTAVWRGEAGGDPAVVVVYKKNSTPQISGASIKLNYRVN